MSGSTTLVYEDVDLLGWFFTKYNIVRGDIAQWMPQWSLPARPLYPFNV